jgi:hypothetical protein
MGGANRANRFETRQTAFAAAKPQKNRGVADEMFYGRFRIRQR